MAVSIILSVAGVVLAVAQIFIIRALQKSYDRRAKNEKEFTEKMIALIQRRQQQEKARLLKAKEQQQQERC